MSALEQFQNQQYLNLETFRKNGEGLRTPVWFVQDGGSLFVRTVADSGKVKRIRNNASVNVAPCKVDGALLGEWVPALAYEITEPAQDRKANDLLGKKYGLLKSIFDLFSKLQGRKSTLLQINLK